MKESAVLFVTNARTGSRRGRGRGEWGAVVSRPRSLVMRYLRLLWRPLIHVCRNFLYTLTAIHESNAPGGKKKKRESGIRGCR